MSKLRFLKDGGIAPELPEAHCPLMIDGKEYYAGMIVDEKEIEPGTVASLLFTRSVERIEDPRQPEAKRNPAKSEK